MYITFFRQGYANNSSSTHSLIFVPNSQKFRTDEDGQFGWHYFVSADKRSKSVWLLCGLVGTYERIYYKKKEQQIKNMTWEQYGAEVNIAATAFVEQYKFDELLGFERIELVKLMQKIRRGDVFVDHQSRVLFPVERKNPEKIQVEFAKHFCNEMLDDRWIIFGGNDNDGPLEEHPKYSAVKDVRMPLRKKEFIRIYNLLADHGPALCELDSVSGDFVLSWQKEEKPYGLEGSILRLRF